jgi:hypothetical protein
VDHLSSTRSQMAQSVVTACVQLTLTCRAPRRTSMRMSPAPTFAGAALGPAQPAASPVQ